MKIDVNLLDLKECCKNIWKKKKSGREEQWNLWRFLLKIDWKVLIFSESK